MNFVKPGPNKRVCAFLTDFVMISTLQMMLGMVWNFKFLGLLSMVYLLLKDIAGGQSLGKRFVGIQILDQKGDPAQPGTAILRNALLVLPFFPLIEYIVMRNNPEGKRLGDMMAGTAVTDLKPETKDSFYLWISLALIACNIFLLAMIAKTMGVASTAPVQG